MFSMTDLWVYYKGNIVTQITRPVYRIDHVPHVDYAGRRYMVLGKLGLQYIEVLEVEGRKPVNSY